MYVLLLLYVALVQTCAESLVDKHMRERTALLQRGRDMMLGHDIILSDKEEKVNEIIMDHKYKILDLGFVNPQYYNFSRHFFSYKDEIKNTELYQILKKMPKGALLHGHDTGMINDDYIMDITYWDNLYVCFIEDEVQFKFSILPPNEYCKGNWKLMSEARYSSGNVEEFDADLRKHFNIIVDNPNEVFSNINAVWEKFQGFFIVTSPLLSYKPAWEHYFYQTLKEFREENIMYIELRSVLPDLYDLDGNVYDSVATAETYKKVTEKFVKENPDFIGMKLIYAPMRFVDNDTVTEYIRIAREIKRKLPGFLAGFDLVGQEDLGQPLANFLPQLTAASEEFDFFFHAGETNWYGMQTDENLVDAIVLRTRRIGHGYALSKYPILMDEVKNRGIAIEVNVVSNAVLGLVNDVRNHPLATFLARDLPVVICSDNPGVWGADPMTHDFIVSFISIANREADLRLLKKLVINSLVYSTVSNKDVVIKEFERRWNHFIDELYNQLNN